MTRHYNIDPSAPYGYQPHYPPPPPPQKSAFQVSGDPSSAPYGHQAYTPAVVEEMPVKEEPPLPCGIGFGWILFILGFFLTVIPWYIGAICFLFVKIDRRERPGCIACTVGAAFSTIFIIIIIAARVGVHHDYYDNFR